MKGHKNLDKSKSKNAGQKLAYLFLTGAGLGWFVGLSASPVLGVVLASTMSVSAALTAALGKFNLSDNDTSPDEKPATKSPISPPNIDPAPFALLVVGMVFGSIVGLEVRTNDLLGVSPGHLADKWSNVGLKRYQIERRIFDSTYPIQVPETATGTAPHSSEQNSTEMGYEESPSKSSESGRTELFYYVSDSERNKLLAHKDLPDLQTTMAGSPNTNIRGYAESCSDNNDLKLAVTDLIAPRQNFPASHQILIDDAHKFQNSYGANLRKDMELSGNTHVSDFAKNCKETSALQAAVKYLICPKLTKQ